MKKMRQNQRRSFFWIKAIKQCQNYVQELSIIAAIFSFIVLPLLIPAYIGVVSSRSYIEVKRYDENNNKRISRRRKISDLLNK